MDVDAADEEKPASHEDTTAEGAQATSSENSQEASQNGPKTPRAVTPKREKDTDRSVDLDALYPMFWGLQAYFSSPTKVFDPQHFATFKAGLESTLSTFKSVNTDLEAQTSNRVSEDLRKSARRKRTADGAEITSSFNPKYLTSRDLFDLEVKYSLKATSSTSLTPSAGQRHSLPQARSCPGSHSPGLHAFTNAKGKGTAVRHDEQIRALWFCVE